MPRDCRRDLARLDPQLRDRRRRSGDGAYGLRRVTYADYTASGRSLAPIEDYIRDAVLPLYANTHSESSGTGIQTTRFREDARRLILEACGGDPAEHVVLFAGSGSTGAIDTLITCLNLRLPADLDARYQLRDHIPAAERPVVFIGPYEHHSNELPWRESIADVIEIPEDHDGRIDLAALEARAERARRSTVEDRQLLGRVERHRHPVGHARASPWRCIASGRCRSGTSRRPLRTSRSRWRRAVPARTPTSTTRMRSSCHRTSSSVGRGPRACWWRVAISSTTRCRAFPAAARWSTSTRSSMSMCATSNAGRRAAPPTSSVRSAPASSSG